MAIPMMNSNNYSGVKLFLQNDLLLNEPSSSVLQLPIKASSIPTLVALIH